MRANHTHTHGRRRGSARRRPGRDRFCANVNGAHRRFVCFGDVGPRLSGRPAGTNASAPRREAAGRKQEMHWKGSLPHRKWQRARTLGRKKALDMNRPPKWMRYLAKSSASDHLQHLKVISAQSQVLDGRREGFHCTHASWSHGTSVHQAIKATSVGLYRRNRRRCTKERIDSSLIHLLATSNCPNFSLSNGNLVLHEGRLIRLVFCHHLQTDFGLPNHP